MSQPNEKTVFQSSRENIARTQLTPNTIAELADGEVLMAVDRFALTANNITYGVAGDSIGYWQFFPAIGADGTESAQWGCIPVWGFADVIASKHPGVPTGERLYGYFPMASHVTLAPEKVTAQGLVDGAAHRSALPVVYNQYSRCSSDPSYVVTQEAEQMLYRPLFTTSFFLDDFLADNAFFAATTVLLTSASSKTSLGLAQLLQANRSCKVVGLTSQGNKEFVQGLGCYQEVLGYDEVAQLALEPTVMVDMAGSGTVRRAVHTHLGDQLRYSCAVGATHWEAASIGGGQSDLPGPKPEMFFAPSQIQKRLKEWGREAYEAKMAVAWSGFLQVASGWIEVEQGTGAEALTSVYKAFIEGKADPAKGYVMSLRSSD